MLSEVSVAATSSRPLFPDYENPGGTKTGSVLLFSDNEIASGLRYLMPALMEK